MKIGLIGNGVVGGALRSYFESKHKPVFVYDIQQHKANCGLDQIFKTDVVFISVPTPAKADSLGDYQYDLSNLNDALLELSSANYQGIVVHKCTVVPGTTEFLASLYKNLKLVHFPEFLTQKNANEDFKNQNYILLSGEIEHCLDISEKVFHDQFFALKNTDYKTTELAKLMHNSYLATKVSFFNEMNRVCKTFRIDFDQALIMAQTAKGISVGHTKVPGPDRRLGFGGMCFVKDTLALSGWAKKNDLRVEVMNAAIEVNKLLRPSAYNGLENTGLLNLEKTFDAIS